VAAPLVFAHRGSSAALPEHTLAAYLRALDEGADGLECDVRLTRDGHLVCVHDRRLDRTSNGRGRVSAHTLAELEQLDFGSWHGSGGRGGWRFETDDPVDPDRTRLLTLDRLLSAVRGAGRDIQVLIETKHPSRYGGDVERRLAALLREHDLPDGRVGITVMSFSPLSVRRVRELIPDLPTALLLQVLPPRLPLRKLPFGARIAGPGIGLIRARPQLVPLLQEGGHPVYAWTVNEREDLDLVLHHGVDGIITDRPRFVLDQLGR
jgi:glycerophosphoryl diester phosphodiesterase